MKGLPIALVILTASVCSVLADTETCSSIPAATRVIKGSRGSAFQVRMSLPGRYTRFTADDVETTINQKDCSTNLVKCTYNQSSQYCAEVSFSGLITEDMKWFAFTSEEHQLMPINIVVFPDGSWADSTPNRILPNVSQPLYINAEKLDNVTLTARFNGNSPTIGIYASLWRGGVYQYSPDHSLSNFDNLNNYPEILGLTNYIDRGQAVYQMVVRRHYDNDYYGFYDGHNWLTYRIQWNSGCILSATLFALLYTLVIKTLS